jgi:hypothetical protein
MFNSSSAFKLDDLTKPETGRQYYFDTVFQNADRAVYRVRIRDVKAKKDVQTLQVILPVQKL